MMRESIQYALDNHAEALEYALQFARDMEPRLAEKFVGMYVNHYTVDAGEVIPKAVQKLLDMGFEAGLISKRVEVEFVELRAPATRGRWKYESPGVPSNTHP
jgi:1,4-dihydroxy-6-naphthoate synthase